MYGPRPSAGQFQPDAAAGAVAKGGEETGAGSDPDPARSAHGLPYRRAIRWPGRGNPSGDPIARAARHYELPRVADYAISDSSTARRCDCQCSDPTDVFALTPTGTAR